MYRIVVATVALSVLGQAGVAVADPSPIREAAERAARELVPVVSAESVELLQQSQPQRSRSRRLVRAVGGFALVGVGTTVTVVGLLADSKGVSAVGIGMGVIGGVLGSCVFPSTAPSRIIRVSAVRLGGCPRHEQVA